MNAGRKSSAASLNLAPGDRLTLRSPEAMSPNSMPMARRLQRSHAPLSFWCQWASLIFTFAAAFVLAATVVGQATASTFGLMTVHKLELLVAIILAMLIYPRFGIFRRLRPPGWAVLIISCAWVAVTATTFAALYLIGAMVRPDAVTLLWVGIVLTVQPAILFLGRAFVCLLRGRSQHLVRSLVVGDGALAKGLISRIEGNPFLPDTVLGLVVEDGAVRALSAAGGKTILGELSELGALVETSEIDRVYVALPIAKTAILIDVQAQLQNLNVDIVWVPDIQSLTLINPGIKEMSGYPLLSLSESPMGSFGNAFMKSFFDVVIAASMLLLLSPLLLLVAIVVKLSSAGPVFYLQHRHGWDGSVFRIYKFRSMVVHEETLGSVSQATQNDARVTRVGRWLRKTSIDELPQLLNVLNGSMSLVGPRPHAVVHNRGYAEEIKSYMLRHRIKPGITGLAQINGWRGETATLDKMRNRVAYDLAYINDWSLWRDFLILLRTPMALLRDRSVH